jgi:UDPglucose 6-dehydrogenase/GDP-mannose 6-dehydrogenase
MKVSIIGSGYVGLVSGACLAERGHEVWCVDVDRAKVDAINRGEPPIFEEGLEALLRAEAGKRLRATTDLAAAVASSELTFVTVGTPSERGEIDLRFIEEAARQIGRAIARKSGYHVVVVKSTVIPGTTDNVVGPLVARESGKQAGRDFGLGMNPEFLTEGQAVKDFRHPDRIVLGGIDERSQEALAGLYRDFAGTAMLRVNNRTAEMIKYASNAMLAVQISFANELAELASRIGGVDITEVMKGVHLSSYLSPALADGTRVRAPLASFLEAGCGFGGSCLPKDVTALSAQGRKLGFEMRILEATLAINREQPLKLLALLGKQFPELRGLRVSVLGLAFKPDTDDMRESPAIPVVRALVERGAQVQAYDPVANAAARRILGDQGIRYCASLREALADARAAILVTRWAEFEQVPELLRELSPDALFIDGRRMLDKRRFERYDGIGI